MSEAGWCERHRRFHDGGNRELALDPGEAGTAFRNALDNLVAHERGEIGATILSYGGRRARDGSMLVPCPSCPPAPGGAPRVFLKTPAPPPVERSILEGQAALISQAQAQPWPVTPLTWAYGVTTVPERRRSGLLGKTLESLKSAGFDQPRLFVDGVSHDEAAEWGRELNLAVVSRQPRILTVGNWLLALIELMARNPQAERYAIFQDDMVTYPNLRKYLESVPYPERGYQNLYTFRTTNEMAIQGKPVGWHRAGNLNNDSYPSDWQKGLGAVGLVFSREAAGILISSPHVPRKLADAGGGWEKVDGMIVTCMNLAGWHEYVHQPSLVQHVGHESTMGERHNNHYQAMTFRGEGFDALELLKELPGSPAAGGRGQPQPPPPG